MIYKVEERITDPRFEVESASESGLLGEELVVRRLVAGAFRLSLCQFTILSLRNDGRR